MRRTAKAIAVVACVAVMSLILGIYGLFHGYFDHGKFEIKQVQWSPSNRVAIVAERSDQEALGGLTYFVLVGNRLFSPAEIRHAYHSNAVVFAATSSCMTLRWDSPTRLVVTCNGTQLDRAFIDAQKRQSGGIAISYENIPLK
jgi:hypothetical protein